MSVGQRILLAVVVVGVPAGLLSQTIMGTFWVGFVSVLVGLPVLFNAHFQRINDLRYRKCDYAQALREFKIWRLMVPTPDYFMLRAGLHSSAQQFDECLKVINQPSFTGYKKENALATYSVAKRDWPAAERHFRAALEHCPSGERVMYLLDLTSHLARRHPKKLGEAFRHWDEALTLPVQPQIEPMLFGIEALLWLGAEEPLLARQILDAHIPTLESEAKKSPLFVPILADAHFQYGRACALMGETSEAFASFTRALDLYPSPLQTMDVEEQIRIIEESRLNTFDDTDLEFSKILRRKEAFEVHRSWPGGSV